MTIRTSKHATLITIDWLNPASSTQLIDVERIDRLTCDRPREATEWQSLLRHGHLARAANLNGTLIGVLLYEACFMGRRIVTVAVEPELQRQGIGTRLIDCLKRQIVNSPHLKILEASVPESQLLAKQFFRSNHFRCTKTIERPRGDAVYLMQYQKPADTQVDAVGHAEAHQNVFGPVTTLR